MPTVEILDGPQEWAGAVFESEDVDAEFGLPHPRWKGTPLASRGLYAYRKVETIGDRHRYRYQGPWGPGGITARTSPAGTCWWRRRSWSPTIRASCGAARSGCMPPRQALPDRTRPDHPTSRAGMS
jgi:hypothetical protein